MAQQEAQLIGLKSLACWYFSMEDTTAFSVYGNETMTNRSNNNNNNNNKHTAGML